jgi:hypothetical protein
MFESAEASPAEPMVDTRTKPPAMEDFDDVGDQVYSGRRYTAADFRRLLARLTKSAVARPKRRRTARHQDKTSPAARPKRSRSAARLRKQQYATVTAGHDAAQPAEAGPDSTLFADPLPQCDTTTAMADMSPGMGEDIAADATASGSSDPAQNEQLSPALEGVYPHPVDGATAADDAEDPDIAGELKQPLDVTTHSDDAEDPDTAVDLQRFDAVAGIDDVEGPDAAVEPTQPIGAAISTDDVEGPSSAVEPAQTLIAHIDIASSLDIQSAETARTLLDIMAMPSGAVQPQERALAGDTLLRLVSRMPVASLISLCDRLCIMEAPPPLLVRRLIHHENVDVAGPLLERCPGISDQDLMTLINAGEAATLRLIARRRHLSPALTDALIGHGDASVLLTVVRNPGASLSPEAFQVLAESAKSRTSLQAPLATRPDTPAPIAFELFWSLPPQLRRYVLSRFLTESATLDRILKIAHALEESNGSESAPGSKTVDKADIDELVELMAQGKSTEAAHKLAALAGISGINARRIITDTEGEPLTVAMKAIGISRKRFADVAATLRDTPEAPLRCDRRIAELQTLFDSLSFTKARVLLTYWDWAVEQSGPYSGEAV